MAFTATGDANVGDPADTAVTNPASSASVIAALKGLLTTLQAGGGAALAGDVAHDAADSGAPVKTGGYAATTAPTAVTAGDRVNDWSSPRGEKVVTLAMTAINDTANAGAAGIVHPNNTPLVLAMMPYLYSGALAERQRNNNEVTVLSSAARTVATNSSDLTNYNSRGVRVVVDLTTYGGAGSITVTIKGKCTLSGKYTTILASAAIASVSTVTLVVYPGAEVTANLSASNVLPRVWRVEVAVGDATSHTYSISANYIN